MVSQGECPNSIIDKSYFVSEMMTSSYNQCNETRKLLLHCKKTSTKSKSTKNKRIRKKKGQRYRNVNSHSN